MKLAPPEAKLTISSGGTFVIITLKSFKERLYRPDIHGEGNRQSGQYALYFALLNILKLYAIYVPHITEYIYQEFYRKDGYEREISLHKTLWETGKSEQVYIEFGEHLKAVIAEVRREKTEKQSP